MKGVKLEQPTGFEPARPEHTHIRNEGCYEARPDPDILCKFPPKFEILFDEIRNVGQIARELFIKNEVICLKQKTDESDIVTDVDLRLEKILIKIIRRYFPELIIRSEESYDGKFPNIYSDHNIAVIDPLDGTANFFTNIPYFCISVFIDSAKDGKVGIICDPINDTTLVGGLNKLELRRGNEETIVYMKNNVPHNLNSSINNVTCAIVSGYNTPATITEPLINYLYSQGIKRVLPLWSPAHDYMNLIINKYDCVILLSEPSFSEAAGLFFVELSENHTLSSVDKKLMGKECCFSVSAHSDYAELIISLVRNYKIL